MVALEVDAESTSKAMDLARSGRVGSRLAMSTGLANSSHRRRPRSAAGVAGVCGSEHRCTIPAAPSTWVCANEEGDYPANVVADLFVSTASRD